MVIINSIIFPSHAGELEDDGESESADDEECYVFHRDGNHYLHSVANYLFHGVSPLLRVSVSDRNLRDSVSSVFLRSEVKIAHYTAI